MDLHLHHLIIHELAKEPDASEALLFLTETTVPVDERAEWLVLKLHRTFEQKEDTLQGYLNSPEDALFPGYFQHFLDQRLSEEAFIGFSRDTMTAFQLALQGVVGAKGGYLVYADYSVYEVRRVGIFFVRDTEGIVFRKKEDGVAFSLDTITYLNTDRLAMACRIPVDPQGNAQDRKVELIKHNKSQKEISDYFINWVGLDRPESSKALTSTFLEVVDQLPLPVDAESGAEVEAGHFREQVVNFALSNPQKTINLEAFNQQFYGEAPTTQQYLQDHDITLENEFRFDRGTLRQFNNHKASAEGIYLYFKPSNLTTGQISTDGETVTIHSPELAEQLAEILMELRRD